MNFVYEERVQTLNRPKQCRCCFPHTCSEVQTAMEESLPDVQHKNKPIFQMGKLGKNWRFSASVFLGGV